MENMLLKGLLLLLLLLYHNWLTNLNISKNIKKKLYIHIPWNTCKDVTCYIKFKLLYKFRIVTFFSFQI